MFIIIINRFICKAHEASVGSEIQFVRELVKRGPWATLQLAEYSKNASTLTSTLHCRSYYIHDVYYMSIIVLQNKLVYVKPGRGFTPAFTRCY